MNLRMVGCSHHGAGVDVRQQLAFGDSQSEDALVKWQRQFPDAELALLSTCNRVELYAAGDAPPIESELVDALLGYHGTTADRARRHITTLVDREAIVHLFRVAASLDSMVVGEPQILAQVKQAYQRAADVGSAGPRLHELFRGAVQAARRVHNETRLHNHRVSIPSVAIADFASRIFERLDDKRVLIVGAGKMADETLRYLREAGARQIYVVNRDPERGRRLANRWTGTFVAWPHLWPELAAADLVVSTTAAPEPVVTAADFSQFVAPRRQQRPLFILDLAAPRDFETSVGDELGVYLYSLDDLAVACERNRQARAHELPAAESIVQAEVESYLSDVRRRVAAPVISRLRQGMDEIKDAELARLFGKLDSLSAEDQAQIAQFADRLVGKLLHPPLESLRDASEEGPPHGLIEALKRLFRLED